jgi:hypothetical protein
MKKWTYDEALAFWKQLIENPIFNHQNPDRLKTECRYCGRLLQHGHIYNYSGEWLHRDCYLTILDFIRATPEQEKINRERFGDAHQ